MSPILWIVLLLVLFMLFHLAMRAWHMMTDMPGSSYRGPVRKSLTEAEKSLSSGLRDHVFKLAKDIGIRHQQVRGSLERSAEYISGVFKSAGYEVREQVFVVNGESVKNVEVEIKGKSRPDEIVVIGAHYDSTFTSPGADDNASGVAAVLELAKQFRAFAPDRTLRFVAFTHEERPNGQNGTMGSQYYARTSREKGENIVAMLALETMGFYSDEKGSQIYPPPFTWAYPSQGNFIGFIGDLSSKELVQQCISSFRRHTEFPSEGVASWRWVPGVGSSDHEPFWQYGYPGVMVTDTAPFRNPHYHELSDIPENVNYHKLAIVVAGIGRVVEELATR